MVLSGRPVLIGAARRVGAVGAGAAADAVAEVALGRTRLPVLTATLKREVETASIQSRRVPSQPESAGLRSATAMIITMATTRAGIRKSTALAIRARNRSDIASIVTLPIRATARRRGKLHMSASFRKSVSHPPASIPLRGSPLRVPSISRPRPLLNPQNHHGLLSRLWCGLQLRRLRLIVATSDGIL